MSMPNSMSRDSSLHVRELLASTLLLVTLPLGGCNPSNAGGPHAHQVTPLVLSYHPLATAAGNKILSQGGNAFDAFIATTVAEYVLTEGVTSAAGPLGALVYSAKTKETLCLDGWWNSPTDPKGRWTRPDSQPGKAILVPGAMRALEALSKRFGQLPFSQSLQPAIELADNGFDVSPLYASNIADYASVLMTTSYGRQTFFRNGQPLNVGDHQSLPVVARFLRNTAANGADYMYKGVWAQAMVEGAQLLGGRVTLSDMSQYEAKWYDPLRTTYRGHDVFATSGRSVGGIWTLLALKALEFWSPPSTHYSRDADALEVLVRLSSEVFGETWIYGAANLDNRALIDSRLTSAYGQQIWNRVKSQLLTGRGAMTSSHSYHVIVADAQGNIITGTNTINTSPWGDGLFVEGIPLSNAGKAISFYYGGPGQRTVSPLSMHLVFKSGSPRFATGAFSFGLIPAELQFLVNLIDYHLSASDAVHLPRFGMPHLINDADPSQGYATNLSAEIDPGIVETLRGRGLYFDQPSPGSSMDLGLGDALVIHDDGTYEGDIVPRP